MTATTDAPGDIETDIEADVETDSDTAQSAPEDAKEPADTPIAETSRAWARNGWTWACLGIVAASAAAGCYGYSQYRSASDQLASLKHAQSERAEVTKVASDYAMKSLTYTFQDADAFFRNVEDGVSPVLKDKYVNAQELLKAIMMQAQVTSSGEILATDATEQPGDVYQVTVAASQTVRSLQNPEQRVTNIVLQVTLNKIGDKWQISDIGPRTGTHAPSLGMDVPAAPGAPTPRPQR